MFAFPHAKSPVATFYGAYKGILRAELIVIAMMILFVEYSRTPVPDLYQKWYNQNVKIIKFKHRARSVMEEVFNYLKSLDVNFLTTRNGNGVSCRPFGDPVKFNNKIYMLTHSEKDVAKQLAENNKICIVAYNPEKDDWLRVFCEAIDDSENMAAKQAIIDEFD